MDSQQQGPYTVGGQDGRGEDRPKVDDFQSQTLPPHPQPQGSYPVQLKSASPPPSASPFAFAPPPLSSNSTGSSQTTHRPTLPLHHSEPPPHHPQYQYYSPKPPLAPHHHSFPTYPGPSTMPHRSFSNDTSRPSPTQTYISRPVVNNGGPSVPSPPLHAVPAADSPYGYPRHPSYTGAGQSLSQSPHQVHQPPSPRANMSNYYGGGLYAQGPPPGGSDMPRSLSYSSADYQSPSHHTYPSSSMYPPHQPHPMSHPPLLGAYQHYLPTGGPPPLHRHDTTGAISHGLAGVDLRGPAQNTLNYNFPHRQPVADRPWKCDECLQSFNRHHDLKRHKRIHLSVKPFGCDKCGKTFSRKDALRRHWLVKGCRGEDGATAPIIPLFPINNSTPDLSPPSPALENSPTDSMPPNNMFPSASMGYNHPSAPPPLSSLPARHSSNQSQIIVTPSDPSSQTSDRQIAVAPPLDEPLSLDPMSASVSMQNRGSGSSADDGYFEGVVGLKSDGTAVIDKSQNHHAQSAYSTSNPMTSSATHPQFHPYRRSSTMHSPLTQTGSATFQPVMRSYSSNDDKPVFAMPFVQSNYNGRDQQDGFFASPAYEPNGAKMEKQNSQLSQASAADAEYQAVAPRWHRPSFPFPPTNNMYNPNFETDQASQHVPTHHEFAP